MHFFYHTFVAKIAKIARAAPPLDETKKTFFNSVFFCCQPPQADAGGDGAQRVGAGAGANASGAGGGAAPKTNTNMAHTAKKQQRNPGQGAALKAVAPGMPQMGAGASAGAYPPPTLGLLVLQHFLAGSILWHFSPIVRLHRKVRGQQNMRSSLHREFHTLNFILFYVCVFFVFVFLQVVFTAA